MDFSGLNIEPQRGFERALESNFKKLFVLISHPVETQNLLTLCIVPHLLKLSTAMTARRCGYWNCLQVRRLSPARAIMFDNAYYCRQLKNKYKK
jgi:hypothetical protein